MFHFDSRDIFSFSCKYIFISLFFQITEKYEMCKHKLHNLMLLRYCRLSTAIVLVQNKANGYHNGVPEG